MTDIVYPPCIRIGPIREIDVHAAAKRCLVLARHYGSAMIAIDEFGIAYAMWPDGRHGRKVLREGLHYVVGTYAPTCWSFDKRDRGFTERVVDELICAHDWQRLAAREIERELAA